MEGATPRRAPLKPWERAGNTGASGTTSTPISRPVSSSNISSTSSLPSSSALTSPSTTALTPRPPARPWDSSRTAYDNYGSSGYGSYANNSYGNNGYGSSYSRSYGGYGSSYNSGYGSSSYDRYGSSSYGSGYSGYGSSYGSSSYDRYGSGSYGGYGSNYGGGYGGGYGGYGNYSRMDPYGPDPKSPFFNAVQNSQSFFGSLQYFVDMFGRFSRLLDANYDAMHGSFTSVIRLVEHMGRLNTEVMMVIKTFTVFRLLQSIVSRVSKLLRYLLGKKTDEPTNALLSVKDFQQFSNPNSNGMTNSLHPHSHMPPPPSNWKRTLLIVAVAFIGLPVVLGKLLNFLAKNSHGDNWDKQWNNGEGGETARAVYDFIPESSRDLEFRKGDVLRIINKAHPEWWEAELNGRVGLVPRNFVELESTSSQSDKQLTMH